MPMYDSLADQIKYFLLNGGDYHVAPDLGADYQALAAEVLEHLDGFEEARERLNGASRSASIASS